MNWVEKNWTNRSGTDRATAVAWLGVKFMLMVWAVLINLVAGRVLPLPVYLGLLALAGALVMRKHVHRPAIRGAQRTWLALLLGLAVLTAAASTVNTAGAQPDSPALPGSPSDG